MRRVQRTLVHWILPAFALVALVAAVKPAAIPPQDAEPLAIVVNRSNPMSEISLADLRKLYRGQRSRWSNGRRVTLVLRVVFNVPGAIGYVRASEVDATVKTLRVDGHLPGEAGYRLEVPDQ